MVLEGKADLQLPPGRAPSGRAASLNASLGSGIALHKLAPRPAIGGLPRGTCDLHTILKGCACVDAPIPAAFRPMC